MLPAPLERPGSWPNPYQRGIDVNDSNGPRTDNQAERRAKVRRHVAVAIHSLTEALATSDSNTLVSLLGAADVQLTEARNETLRGQL